MPLRPDPRRLLGAPNTPDRVRDGLLGGLQELALVAHALPSAELVVTFRDGRRFRVGAAPGSLMTPCLFRQAVGRECASSGSVPWFGLVERITLGSPRCRDLGAGLYGAWCAGAVVHAFATAIDLDVLVAAIEALPECATAVRVVPDPLLGLHLVTVESPPATAPAEAVDLARELQATVLVAELELTLRTA